MSNDMRASQINQTREALLGLFKSANPITYVIYEMSERDMGELIRHITQSLETCKKYDVALEQIKFVSEQLIRSKSPWWMIGFVIVGITACDVLREVLQSFKSMNGCSGVLDLSELVAELTSTCLSRGNCHSNIDFLFDLVEAVVFRSRRYGIVTGEPQQIKQPPVRKWFPVKSRPRAEMDAWVQANNPKK